MLKRKSDLFFLWLLLFSACAEQAVQPVEVVSPVNEILSPPESTCGSTMLVDVQDLEGSSVGVFEVLNDQENLWLTFSPNASYKMFELYLYIGAEGGIPKDESGSNLPREFPLRLKNETSEITWNYFRPLNGLPECFVVSANVQVYSRKQHNPAAADLVTAWTTGTDRKKEPSSIYFCPRFCDSENVSCPSGTDPGQYQTLDQEAWRVALSDEGYQDGFASVFPEGLRLGCNAEIQYLTAEALQKALPMRGQAEVFWESEENPENIQNSLAGEACALTLTLGYDKAWESFSASPVRLSRLLVAGGAFDGWQVSDLLGEANAVLGGCASNYSASQMEEVLRNVNLNFAGGDKDGKFLRCP